MCSLPRSSTGFSFDLCVILFLHLFYHDISKIFAILSIVYFALIGVHNWCNNDIILHEFILEQASSNLSLYYNVITLQYRAVENKLYIFTQIET